MNVTLKLTSAEARDLRKAARYAARSDHFWDVSPALKLSGALKKLREAIRKAGTEPPSRDLYTERVSRRKKFEKRQDFLWRVHDEEGLRRFGKKRWDGANIGWGSTDVDVASKVYGDPAMVFSTRLSVDGNTASHNVELY